MATYFTSHDWQLVQSYKLVRQLVMNIILPNIYSFYSKWLPYFCHTKIHEFKCSDLYGKDLWEWFENNCHCV